MVKIGEDIRANDSLPIRAWQQKMYPTGQGLVFFAVEGEKLGPFKISANIL
jgi:hypothetical protein